MKKYLKLIALLLISVFLFQGCYVTREHPRNRRAKVVRTDGIKHNYYRVSYGKDSVLYGQRMKNSQKVKIYGEVSKVKYLNTSGTIVLALVIPAGVLVVSGVIWGFASGFY